MVRVGDAARARSSSPINMARAAAACSWPRLAAPRALPRLGAAAPRQLVHGTEHHDEFAWLSDERSEAVAAQLEAEARYTHAHLQPLVAAQMRLYNAMASGLAAAAESAPEPWGAYEYFTRTPARRDLPQFCRRR